MQHTILVTGGAGGIGSAVVKRFLQADFHVVILDNKQTPKEYESARNVQYISIDITDYKRLSKLSDSLHDQGTCLKHIVSLAGGALLEEFEEFEKSSTEAIQYSINLNLTSHICLIKYFKKLFLREDYNVDKSITLISSINAIMDFGLPAYSSAKAGLLGLTKALACDLGKSKIRINSILPGTVLTQRSFSEPKPMANYSKGSVLGRVADPDEIATVVFCLAEYFSCVTGQCLVADCGQTVKSAHDI